MRITYDRDDRDSTLHPLFPAPLPNYNLEREKMRAYYERHYGADFEYAYAIPAMAMAMAMAVQAAGRVIRSETDRGLIVLLDSRFVQPGYFHAMPADWFRSRADELVSGSILKEVSEFCKLSYRPVNDTKDLRKQGDTPSLDL